MEGRRRKTKAQSERKGLSEGRDQKWEIVEGGVGGGGKEAGKH